jgi:hypothetical protein
MFATTADTEPSTSLGDSHRYFEQHHDAGVSVSPIGETLGAPLLDATPGGCEASVTGAGRSPGVLWLLRPLRSRRTSALMTRAIAEVPRAPLADSGVHGPRSKPRATRAPDRCTTRCWSNSLVRVPLVVVCSTRRSRGLRSTDADARSPRSRASTATSVHKPTACFSRGNTRLAQLEHRPRERLMKSESGACAVH